MSRQSSHVRLLAERNPQDPALALDTEIAADLVRLADSLRNGRKASGTLVRINKLAAGATAPRPSDLLHLAAAGVDPAALVLVIEKMIAAVKAAAPASRPCPAQLVRELNEGVASVIEYRADPSPEALTKAERELAEAELVIERERAGLKADRDARHAAHFRAVHYLRTAGTPATPAPRAD